ncbi:MAG TPA: hypothetical protein PKH46_06030 [Candidatus Cryosericum sp.]|nr:hypothetical protein [Candidatus Cryosericum sp.]
MRKHPDDIDPKTRMTIVQGVAHLLETQGLSFKQACTKNLVGSETVRGWTLKFPEIREMITRAQTNATADAQARVFKTRPDLFLRYRARAEILNKNKTAEEQDLELVAWQESHEVQHSGAVQLPIVFEFASVDGDTR